MYLLDTNVIIDSWSDGGDAKSERFFFDRSEGDQSVSDQRDRGLILRYGGYVGGLDFACHFGPGLFQPNLQAVGDEHAAGQPYRLFLPSGQGGKED